ncbi:hypothetical protein MTO96_027150 [Rhipicephalus appendiculatus]|uniref:Swi/snf-related matrix-associated actin-dependent regulator n=1 Tax=Rhipicephalus appendiculatus TaxID=34631 RepID=A0A131YK02_RHIAP
MSNSLVNSGTGSSSLLSTLRQFRPRKRCLQQNSVTEQLQSHSNSSQNQTHGLPSVLGRNESATVSPGTSESSLKRPCRNIAKSPDTSRGNQPRDSAVNSEQGPSTSTGVKRKLPEPCGKSRVSGQPAPSALKRTVKKEKESSEDESSDEEGTKYMTDKEKSLKQIIEEFKGADVMALQDALVTCKWDVCETRAYLQENPPRRMAPNPYRNAQFNIFPSSGSRNVDTDSEEEREPSPQEAVTTRNEPSGKNATRGVPKPQASTDPDTCCSPTCCSQRTVELVPVCEIKVEAVSDDEEQIDGDVHGMTSDTDESDEETDRTPVKVEPCIDERNEDVKCAPVKIEPRISMGLLNNASSDELVTIPVCRPKLEAVEENGPDETWTTVTNQQEPEDAAERNDDGEEFILPTEHATEQPSSSVEEKQINPGDFVAVEIKENSSKVLMAASLYATALQHRMSDDRQRTRLRRVQPL